MGNVCWKTDDATRRDRLAAAVSDASPCTVRLCVDAGGVENAWDAARNSSDGRHGEFRSRSDRQI